MAKTAPLQSNFLGGEFSPLLAGRVDSERYKSGLAVCKNYIPMIQGGVTRRPGTVVVEEVKDSSKVTRVVKFKFSVTQAYMLEMGDGYFRFYKNYGQILDGGPPYEVVTPYLEADLWSLRFVQSADVLYITSPLYPPAKLTRTADTAWTLTTIDFLDGPYFNDNMTGSSGAKSTATITPSATTGSVTLTASSALFAATDVGRLVRLNLGGWSWAVITAFTDTTHVTATIKGPATTAAPISQWRLGVWSVTTGYPAVATFHEDRLAFSGCISAPQRIDMSQSGDYENFATTDAAGTVQDNYGLSFSLNSTDVNFVRWMLSQEKGLAVGTVGGEWTVVSSFTGSALTPTTVSAKQVTAYGSADVQAALVGKGTMFVQNSGRKVRELQYYFQQDGFLSQDRTIIAEHITGKTGLKELAYQKDPQSILWAARQDGTLVGMTYEQDLDNLVVAWHRHQMGGVGDAIGSAPYVESIAVIPSPDGTREDVWMIVRRYVDGQSRRFVEYMSKIFEDTDLQKDAFFVDCGLTYDNPLSITGVSSASTAVVTCIGHGLSNGAAILVSDVFGVAVPDSMDSWLNGQTFLVSDVTTDTFKIKNTSGAYIDTTGYSAYVQGGSARKYITTIAGLDYLEGESVSILGDGAVQPDRIVESGQITLATRATTVHVGLGFNSDGQLLRLESGSQNGTALGKTRRTNRVGFILHRSLGLKIGTDFVNMNRITFRKTSDPLSRAPGLFTGILSETLDADYDFENQITWRQDQPLPSTILAIAPQMDTQDRG